MTPVKIKTYILADLFIALDNRAWGGLQNKSYNKSANYVCKWI